MRFAAIPAPTLTLSCGPINDGVQRGQSRVLGFMSASSEALSVQEPKTKRPRVVSVASLVCMICKKNPKAPFLDSLEL